MGKTVFIVPSSELLESVQSLLPEFPGAVDEVYHISPSASASVAAEKYIADGADIIIARGLQAAEIAKHYDVKVLAMRMTAQEIAVLVSNAKKLCSVERPKIALLSAENMLPDLSAFNELFDIDLEIYYCSASEVPGSSAHKAIDDGADAVIGGIYNVQVCHKRGIPAIYLSSSAESVRETLNIAIHMRKSIEERKKIDAQYESIFYGAFNGLIIFDREGIAQRCNPTAAMHLNLKEAKICNAHISTLFPKLDMQKFNDALETGTTLSDFTTVKRQSFAIIVKPVVSDNVSDGAILAFRKTTKDLNGWNSSQNINRTSFAIATDSPALKSSYNTAKLLSRTTRALLMRAEIGVDTLRLAKCIHANSDCSKAGQFIHADSSCWSDSDQQNDYLFGYDTRAVGDSARGVIGLAEGGTLFLDRIDYLATSVQHRLWQTICNKRFIYLDSANPKIMNFRLIARTTLTSDELFSSGRLIPELCYILAPMSFTIPPLRETREDLPQIIEDIFTRFCSDYSRFLTLTPEAMAHLCSYDWPGNSTELNMVIERIIISADEQNISRAFVKSIMQNIQPSTVTYEQQPDSMPKYTSDELRVIHALRKYNGDRELTASELGISKTTLWRWMKKYDITTKY